MKKNTDQIEVENINVPVNWILRPKVLSQESPASHSGGTKPDW